MMGEQGSPKVAQRDLDVKFRLVSEAVPDGIVLADEEGRIFWWNKGAQKIFGYTKDEVLGKPLTMLMPERYRAKHKTGMERACSNGKAEYAGGILEVHGLRKDGTEVPVEVSVGGWVENGKRFFKGIIRDISIRKAHEEALRQSEEYYRLLFENSPFPAWVYDLETQVFLTVNESAVEHYGYSREEFLSMTIRDIRPPEDIPRLLENLSATGGIYEKSSAWRHLKKDGTMVYAEITSQALEFQGRKARLVFANDITDRLKAEQEIQKYVDIVNNMQIGLYVFHLENLEDDATLRLITANSASVRFTGIPVKEVLGKTLDENFSAARAQGFPRMYAQVVRTGEPLKIEETAYGDDRMAASFFSVWAFPLPGHCVGVAFEDISERKQAQEKEKMLLKELEQANRELNDFAQVVSHDLKAPLRGINSLATWLLADYGDKLDEEGKTQLQLLSGRVKRMHGLIDGVLQYSRVARLKEEKVGIDLNRLVREIWDSLGPALRVELLVEGTLPAVTGEKTKIAQVFQNLLSNAVKFMDKPRGEIRIDCAEEENFWRFCVKDNGPGIEEKYFEKIFQIFQTLSSREGAESAGVGLTIVKKIVETNGGKIWVESAPGIGSSFCFTLPK